jgi:hypothetical protein
MSIKKTALTTLFATAIVFTGSVQAQESHVERVLSSMVNQAMQTATTEINEEIQKSILTTAYNFSFATTVEPSAPVTKVTITDLASKKSTESETTEKSED